ncbi:MAG: hypothetical protein ACE5SV_03190 [Candidatus Nitrosomaritimum aestuariumsis]
MDAIIENMKIGIAIVIFGLVMIVCGLVLFYSIPTDPSLDGSTRALKHGGTFAGLMGIGIVMAGILLHLMSREEPQIQENFDV